jgi:hypothetical protein
LGILTTQSQGGFPLKITAAIAVVWNLLLLIDIKNFFGEIKQVLLWEQEFNKH